MPALLAEALGSFRPQAANGWFDDYRPIVAMFERAAGTALDTLKRRHQQSHQAIEALCCVIENEFLPD